MGWLWGSSKSDASSRIQPPLPPQSSQSNDSALPSPLAPAPVREALTREEQANEDLKRFMDEIASEFDTARKERIQSRESGALKDTTPLPDDISPDSLYPSEIHCRSAFDYAMFCQSFGGQFVNVYRYGSFRSCSNHWDDFWLCMRTRQWGEKDRKGAIKDHYRNKAVKYKTGPSSEDVWKVRSEPVKDAFQDSLEDLEARIAQWKKANPTTHDPWAEPKDYNLKDNATSKI